MAGSTNQKDGEAITEINITPLVDVCLVLVIIFMAVAPMAMVAGIKVLESRAKAAEGKVAADDNVQVRLTESGVITVNGQPVQVEALRQTLLGAVGKSKDKMVIITADERNRVGQVVSILDTAKQSGALKLAIMKNDGGASTGK